LRAGQTKIACTLFETLAQKPRDIMQEEAESGLGEHDEKPAV
jgi:hypothetical protein